MESATPVLADVEPSPPPRREVSPLELARLRVEQTKRELQQISVDPEFNGYEKIVKLAKDGTPSSGLKEAQLLSLMSAIEKPVVSAPIRVKETGVIEIPGSGDFVAVISALAKVPQSLARNPNLEERVRADLAILAVGRKVARDSRVMVHYRAGLKVQKAALADLAQIIKGGALSAEDLRGLIAALQMEVSSPQELVKVLDTEYLLACRELVRDVSDPVAREREENALAARYMKMRSYFAEDKPPAGGFVFNDVLPQTQGCAWTQSRPDFMADLGRSREAATLLASVELQAALAAYKLEEGSYPESLEKLVPGYLTRVPPNTLAEDGAFDYQPTSASYRLAPTSPLSSSSPSTPSPGLPKPSSTPERKP